jgi:hypothetical protein
VTVLLGACDPEETKPRPDAGNRRGVNSPAGFERPKGVNSVSRSARGTPGEEKVTFRVGMGPATGGFELKLEEVPLTAEPKQYTIGLSRVAYGKVVGAPTRLNGA